MVVNFVQLCPFYGFAYFAMFANRATLRRIHALPH
jgi:hypothetical protein